MTTPFEIEGPDDDGKPDKLIETIVTGDEFYLLGETTVEYDEGGIFDPARRDAVVGDKDVFTIDGPNAEGNVYLKFAWDIENETCGHYLGPKDQVAEKLSDWLAQIEFDATGDALSSRIVRALKLLDEHERLMLGGSVGTRG